MADVGLLYVGAVLFVNGLMLLNRVDSKSASIFNLFVGTLQVITPLYLITSSQGDPSIILSASGIFLFGFTYLYVGFTNLLNLKTTGLGWYCLWVAILALGFSYVNFIQFSDIKFGIIWLLWSYLWLLFFLLLGLGKEISHYVGKVTIVLSWVTATIPAFLSLTGGWTTINNIVVYIVTFGVLAYFVFAGMNKAKSNQVNKSATVN